MKVTKKIACSALSFAVFAGLMAGPALAHPGGHATGMIAGLAHPLLGVDHLLAMVAVGLWAAMQPARRAGYGPLVFLAMIAIGAMLGLNGVALSFVEPGILASVILLGLMVMVGRIMPVGVGLAAISGFALLHGQAHGLEGGGSGALFVAGMLVMSTGLHLVGYGFGRWFHQLKYGAWIAGSFIAAGGLALINA